MKGLAILVVGVLGLLTALAVGAFRRPAPPVPAPCPVPVDPGRAALARERSELEAMARRLDERQHALEAREAAPSPARTEPAPEPKPSSEEGEARAHVLATGGELGTAMKKVLEDQHELSGRNPGGKMVRKMQLAMDLLSAMTEFRKDQERMQGDLAADTLATGLDQLMPDSGTLTEEQKARFRVAYAAAERQVDVYEVPRQELFFSILGGWGGGLSQDQANQVFQIHQGLRAETEGILDPDQKTHLDRLLSGWSLNLSW
jgi:hypothetical protein